MRASTQGAICAQVRESGDLGLQTELAALRAQVAALEAQLTGERAKADVDAFMYRTRDTVLEARLGRTEAYLEFAERDAAKLARDNALLARQLENVHKMHKFEVEALKLDNARLEEKVTIFEEHAETNYVRWRDSRHRCSDLHDKLLEAETQLIDATRQREQKASEGHALATERLTARLAMAEQEAQTAREYLVNEQRLSASMTKKIEDLQQRLAEQKTWSDESIEKVLFQSAPSSPVLYAGNSDSETVVDDNNEEVVKKLTFGSIEHHSSLGCRLRTRAYDIRGRTFDVQVCVLLSLAILAHVFDWSSLLTVCAFLVLLSLLALPWTDCGRHARLGPLALGHL